MSEPQEVSTKRAYHYVTHWVHKKHWSKPGFDYDTSDFPTMARRDKKLGAAAARARALIDAGAALMDHVEIYGIDRFGGACAVYWLNEDGTVSGMDMDG